MKRPHRETVYMDAVRSEFRGGTLTGYSVARSRAGGAAGGVVAVPRTGLELAATARRDDLDLNGAEGAVALRIGRIVGQGVLVANVVSYLFADVMNIFYVFREIREAAGGLGDLLESA